MENKNEFRYRLPTVRLIKWYEKDKKLLGASLDIDVWQRSVNFNINPDVSAWKLENLNKFSIPMDTAFFIFNFLKEHVNTIEENSKIKIPIIKPVRDDKNKLTGDTISLVDMIFGRNDKEYYVGFIFHQGISIKFVFQPPVSSKQWYIAKNDNIIDTVMLSKVQARSWIDRTIDALRVADAEYIHRYNNSKPNKEAKQSNTNDMTGEDALAVGTIEI